MRKMKYSNIEWVGDIPANWEIKKIKYVADIFGRIGFRGYTEQDLVDYEEDGAITLSPSNFHDMKMDYTKCTYLNWKKYEESPEIKIYNDDVLLVKTGSTYGKAVYVTNLPKEATINPQLIVFKNIKMNSKLFSYILQTKIIKIQSELAVIGATIPTMSQEKIYNFIISFPPIEEQQQIADYLDEKCTETDSLISELKKQIETLEEYKKSIITETVTKGLNPDAEMKDSGVDWIGHMPEHWDFIKGKYIFAQRSEKGNTINLQLLSPTQKFGVIPQSLFEEMTTNTAVKINEKTDLNQFKTIHNGDYCISLRSFQGGFEYSVYEGVVSPAYQVFYPTIKISDGYYKYLFKDQSFIEKMNSYTMSLRDGKNIAFSDFGNTFIPVPPIEEQQAIADYLDKKCTEINAIISGKKHQIQTIEEYKKSLIFEYVTGKKEI